MLNVIHKSIRLTDRVTKATSLVVVASYTIALFCIWRCRKIQYIHKRIICRLELFRVQVKLDYNFKEGKVVFQCRQVRVDLSDP